MSININNISINNFNNVCRTCAQSNDLISIPENIYLIEMLSTSVHLQIQLNDELPKNICINCIKDLNQSYAFISKCKAADAVFRQCLTQQKLLHLKENHEKHTTKTNKHEMPEEIFIKTEISDDNDECNNDSISDECSKDSIKQPNIDFEHPINANFCANCNKSFPTSKELISHLNACQFQCLLEPMEQDESSDDDTPLDDTSSILPEMKSQIISDMSEASNSTINNLPEKSKFQYENTYKVFKEWCRKNSKQTITETVVLSYFEEKAGKVKASTLWSMYSMLKSTLQIKDNLDIRNFQKLVPYLKKKSVGHCPKKSQVLTREQIEKFMTEADNLTYLMMKILLIMGVSGACRRDELTNMTIDDIEDLGSVLIVKVPDSRSFNSQRTFTVTNLEYIKLYRKYSELRPPQITNRRLFLKYHNGKCVNQVVGINKIGAIPSLIAQFLKLPNPGNYTGHCFRKTSIAIFANL